MASRLAAVVLCLAPAVLLGGCESLQYYSQAVNGHMSLVSRARPVDSLLADPGTPQALRDKLAATRSMREFASRELKLPDNGSYRSYSDLERPYAVWNVVAAPEFAVQPVESCFPFAGCVAYRGFFALEDAERYAAGLRAQGHDVFVGGVPAYSTLGWFDDPLLSTFMRYPETEIARLLFHELSHQQVYVKGDSTFNESFAIAVEREGMRRWLAANGRPGEAAQFALQQRRAKELAELLEEARARLQRLYRQRLAPEALRERKRAEFRGLAQRYQELKRSWDGFAGYDRLFEQQAPNNALLASFATYNQYVPGFERLLAESGGDLPKFYARVKELAALDKGERERRLGAAGAKVN